MSEKKRRIGWERPASITIGGQTLVDLGVSWDTHFGRQPVTLSAWCYNLFDKDYWYAAGGIISASVHREPMRSLRSSSSKEMLIASDFIPLPIF